MSYASPKSPFKVSCGGRESCLWNFEGVVIVFVDGLCVSMWFRVNLATIFQSNTNRCQPMDARIIPSFKAQYGKQMIEHKISCLMSTQNLELDMYQAVVMIVHSWRHGDTPKTIQNH